MSVRTLGLVVTFTLAVALVACGGEAEESGGTAGSGQAEGEMTKAQMIKDLRGMAGNLEAGALDELVEHFVMPPGMTVEKAKPSLAKSIKRELSIEGIDMLEAKATFGKLTDLFPERGANWATRLEIKPEECYALKHGGAEIAAHWNGSNFRYLRVDDVAKLK